MAEEARRIEIEKNGEDDSGDGAFGGSAHGAEMEEGAGDPLQQRVEVERREGRLPDVKLETESVREKPNTKV